MSFLKKILKYVLLPFRWLWKGVLVVLDLIGKISAAVVRYFFKPTAARKLRFAIFGIFILAALAGFLDYPKYWDKAADYLNGKNEAQQKVQFAHKIKVPHFWNIPFHLGLDLQGGTHLLYKADLAGVEPKNYNEAMSGLRDVIERRVNLYGVSEPVVQVDKSGEEYRLVVELAGVKDIKEAIKMIGDTPYLEFKEQLAEAETNVILEARKNNERLWEDPYFKPTRLTGKYLKKAALNFDQNTGAPYVDLEFDSEGADIFAEITKQNIGKILAIYLDGAPISLPRVNAEITGGKAQITGQFSIDEAKQLVRRLNSGALPVPVTLIGQQNVGASLGQDSLMKSLRSGIYGILAVAVFMIFWYRLPGLLAVAALLIYTALTLAIFKTIPVTLTLAGIAGFILSIGMAVDANILIFERLKEELKRGRSLAGSVDEGFARAWTSIRDSNISSLITCGVLYWFGSSIIRGFALTLAIGIFVSMFSAITITRTLLKIFLGERAEKHKWLFKAGIIH